MLMIHSKEQSVLYCKKVTSLIINTHLLTSYLPLMKLGVLSNIKKTNKIKHILLFEIILMSYLIREHNNLKS